MEEKTKHSLLCITFGVVLFVALMNLNIVGAFVSNIFSLLFPLIAGLIIAFILSVPQKGFERLLSRFSKKTDNPPSKSCQRIAFLLTILTLILIVTMVVTVTIPAVVSSLKSIIPIVEEKWPEWMAYLESWNIDTNQIKRAAVNFDLEGLLAALTGNIGILISSVFNASVSLVSSFTTAAVSFIIACYVLLSRHDLARQSKTLLYTYTKKEFADKLCIVPQRIRKVYTKFLSGQCVEAVILGFLMFLGLSVFQLPYSGLVGVLTGCFSFVPYVGTFVACGLGAILILIVDPAKVIIGIAVYMGIQFVENHFIYPNVVGSSVGLPPLWTLVTVTIGGKLFGLLGMIFFIPLTATVYSLIKEDVHRRNGF